MYLDEGDMASALRRELHIQIRGNQEFSQLLLPSFHLDRFRNKRLIAGHNLVHGIAAGKRLSPIAGAALGKSYYYSLRAICLVQGKWWAVCISVVTNIYG